MSRPRSSTPTAGELEILRIFWQRGVCTIREIHEVIQGTRPVAQTTVSSMVQLMHDKSLLTLVDERRPQRYEAAIQPDQTKDSLIKELIGRAFDGSPKRLVMHLLSGKKASKEQMDQVEKLLDELD